MEMAIAGGRVREVEHDGGEVEAVEGLAQARVAQGNAEDAGAAAEVDALRVGMEMRHERLRRACRNAAVEDRLMVLGPEAVEGGLDGGNGTVARAPDGVVEGGFHGPLRKDHYACPFVQIGRDCLPRYK